LGAISRPARNALLVATLAAAVYLNALPGDFVYDDNSLLVANPWLRSASHIPRLLAGGIWNFRGEVRNCFRPGQMLSYMPDILIFGLNPLPLHVHNLVYHVLASLAVLWVLRLWIRCEPAALAGGLLFAVHPIHTEAVSCISGMGDVGCGLFFALALLLLMAALDASGAARRWLARGGAAGCFLVALSFKEMAAVLPLI